MTVEAPTSRASHLLSHPGMPLVEELTPAPDAWQALQQLAHLPHALFLDSALVHPELGRYSYVTADPFAWLVFSAGQPGNAFDPLGERLRSFQVETLPDLPPFQGGAAGLFGYGLCHHVESLPRPAHDEFAVPDLAIGLYDWVVSFDHVRSKAYLVSTGFPQTEAIRRMDRAAQRAQRVRRLLKSTSAPLVLPRWNRDSTLLPQEKLHALHAVPSCPDVFSNFDKEGYLAAVGRAIEYIRAGDCYQVNIAQRLLAQERMQPLELYGRLRACNPAPFAGFFDLGNFVIASASPERFVQVQDGAVETRPIKGTRPRGATPAEDQANREALLASPKDRAENVMIVDLMRNDLGRVCRYGSVRVPSVCHLESYRTVHHLVSEVRGILREGLGPVDLLKAAFPGGSVTGAPKIRAMEIIAELEPTARGPYCGCLGYVGFDGSMDTNILIRTFTIGRGWMQFPVGGGIVADSDPEREYEETWHKAEGLLRAL